MAQLSKQWRFCPVCGVKMTDKITQHLADCPHVHKNTTSSSSDSVAILVECRNSPIQVRKEAGTVTLAISDVHLSIALLPEDAQRIAEALDQTSAKRRTTSPNAL